MRTRTWAIFILVNVIVSAAVMLTILFIWERAHAPAPSTPAPTSTPPATEEAAPPPSAPPVASPTVRPNAHDEAPPGPLLYVVQEGDTLGAIAQTHGLSIEDLMAANGLTDPNTLHIGQTLIIPAGPLPTPTAGSSAEAPPEPSPAATALPTPLPTLTPSGPPLVEIAQVLGSGDLPAEVVVVRNRGGAITLEEWTLSDTEGHTFTFPAIALFADVHVRVHSAAGSSTPTDLYWGRLTPAWTGGTLITLRDAAGNVVDTYIVP
jgi:LysM repeat protein